MEYKTNGTHVIADFYGVKVSAINDLILMQMLLKKAIEISGAEVISWNNKQFFPGGITTTAILSESSLDFHSWPEHDFCSLSIYTCGEKANPKLAIAFLEKTLKPSKVNYLNISRGEKSGLVLKEKLNVI